MLHAPPIACRGVRRLAAALPTHRATDDAVLRDGGPGARPARTRRPWPSPAGASSGLSQRRRTRCCTSSAG